MKWNGENCRNLQRSLNFGTRIGAHNTAAAHLLQRSDLISRKEACNDNVNLPPRRPALKPTFLESRLVLPNSPKPFLVQLKLGRVTASPCLFSDDAVYRGPMPVITTAFAFSLDPDLVSFRKITWLGKIASQYV